MDIFEAIRADHDELRDLLEKLDASSERASKATTKHFNQLKEIVQAHHEAEAETFYPVMLDEMDYREIALKALEEHAVILHLMASLEELSLDDEKFKPRLAVFHELLEMHIEEEEEDLFDHVQEILTDEEAQEVGRMYLQQKLQAKKTPKGRRRQTEELPEEEEEELETVDEEDEELEEAGEPKEEEEFITEDEED